MQEMEDCWPSGVGPAGVGVKPPCAALAEDRRGERQGNGAARSRQVGIRKTSQSARPGRSGGVSLLKRRKPKMASKPRVSLALAMSLADTRVLARRRPA